MTALVAAPEPPRASTALVELAIADLRDVPSMRERGIDPAHVAALAEVVESWPPIVVNRSDLHVVDGQHRVRAAKQLGLRHLCAVWFDGSPDDSYVEFVRCNVSHGLPLTLVERRAAARRLVRSRPELSDRGIAQVCGLSPRTVARLREEAGADTSTSNGSRHAKGRIGRDGRVRPIDPAGVRARIAEELARSPDASLRAIACAVGASPETVRSVRNEMRTAELSSPHETGVEHEPDATVLGLLSRSRKASIALAWGDDRALTDRENGQQFVDWFGKTSVEQGDLWRYLESVPLSRVYEIADESRRRAEFWTRFALAAEGKVRRRS
jgi:ParB-like chromosome segregation protein Spo0J